MPVLRRRAAGWCLDNSMPEEALEYSMAAGDVDGAARLAGPLAVPAYRQGRVTTIQRWFGWLEDRGGIEAHPMTAVLASLFSALMGRPVDAERWADAVDRWQYGDPARPDDPSAEAWAAMIRAVLCRRGVERMRADADEAVRRFAAGSFLTPTPALMQGIARVLGGDLDGGDECLEDAVRRRRASRLADGCRVGAVRAGAGGDGTQPMGPGRGPGRPGTFRLAPGRDGAELRDAPDLRAASALSHAPGRCPGGAPGTAQCPAPAAVADLRAPPLCRSGPARAGPRPPGARRPGRCQDGHARGR